MQSLIQCLTQFESDTDAAEIFARIRALRLIGIDDGECFRQSFARQVVVSDDDVYFILGVGDFLNGGDTAVDRNN